MHKTLKFLLLACLPVLALAGCSNNKKSIVVGASSTPHALILEQTKGFIEESGYKLEIKVFNDYVLPNYALENGELDANYFQHKPYLNEFNESNGTHLVPVLDVHFEPMGIYKGNKSALESFSNGDTVLVPSDKSNYDRAVELLKVNGMEKANLVQVEAQNIPLMLSDCSYAVINGNYALSAGVVDKCLITEDKNSEIAKTMANVIAVKKGNEEAKKTLVLKEALSQVSVGEYIQSKFGDSVIYML